MERKTWTEQEDNILRMIIEVKKIKKWSSIARMMEVEYGILGRTGKQCRERWHNKLDPTINGENWTRQEQELLFKYHNLYGNKWAKIAKVIEGRSDNCIKNHFYSTLRKAFRGVNKFITDNKKRSQLRPLKNNVLSKIILLAEQFFDNKIKASDQQLQDCIEIKNSLIEFVLNNETFSCEKMENLIHKISNLSKNIKIKKPKKKKRVYMDMDLSAQEKFVSVEQKPKSVQKIPLPTTSDKPKPPQRNAFRLCDIRLTEVKLQQEPAQEFLPKQFLPHELFNKSSMMMPTMPTMPNFNFYTERATNQMLMRQSSSNLDGSGQYYFYNLSPFVRKFYCDSEMDQSTAFISGSLNYENLWDSGRLSDGQGLLVSTAAPQQSPASMASSTTTMSNNVYIPIPTKVQQVKTQG